MLHLASFLFGWDIDSIRSRVIFYTLYDLNGRNIKHFGQNYRRYPRWVELGYENELMRLTDFVNSLHLDRRQKLVPFLNQCGLMRPNDNIVYYLWELAKGHISFEFFEANTK